MFQIGWPAAFVIIAVALFAAALLHNHMARNHELRKDLVIKAYQAESIEANKELEVQRHKIEELSEALGTAEDELNNWRRRYAREDNIKRAAKANLN